jgi:hypothetical protein
MGLECHEAYCDRAYLRGIACLWKLSSGFDWNDSPLVLSERPLGSPLEERGNKITLDFA